MTPSACAIAYEAQQHDARAQEVGLRHRVAAKPANKAVQSAVEQSAGEPAVAEPGEPRAETKGNADQQSTCRAQSRVSVSQALDPSQIDQGAVAIIPTSQRR